MAHRPQTARMTTGGCLPRTSNHQPPPPPQFVPVPVINHQPPPPQVDAPIADPSVHVTPPVIPFIPIPSAPQLAFQLTAADLKAAQQRMDELMPLAKKKNQAVTKLIIKHYGAEMEALAHLPMEATSPPAESLDNFKLVNAYSRSCFASALVDDTWEDWVDNYYQIFGQSVSISTLEWDCHDEEMRRIDNAVPIVFGDFWFDKYI
ncbi:hypothetical protein BT96DRAFT_1003162 [Gymnopus androsaceus JB14]|uniref:Uncharacterized protein n=1 Tax=Gymnopus androsaceus JB14 TaxID=1447944 RepID=A0A6A4GVT0_9AGAR|nr:hypothetical protein BT96DRAFT_1003162 [Gymnopus androsaceus JB14]